MYHSFWSCTPVTHLKYKKRNLLIKFISNMIYVLIGYLIINCQCFYLFEQYTIPLDKRTRVRPPVYVPDIPKMNSIVFLPSRCFSFFLRIYHPIVHRSRGQQEGGHFFILFCCTQVQLDTS